MKDLLRYRPLPHDDWNYRYNEQPNSFEHIFERNRLCKCYEKLCNGERPSQECVDYLCRSKEMCILLLLFNVPISNNVRNVSVRKTLIQNGYKYSAFQYWMLESEYISHRKARISFIGLRKRIVILLGIKSKRCKFPQLDRFVIKEIALEMWYQRYQFYDRYHHNELKKRSDQAVMLWAMLFMCIFVVIYLQQR